MKPSTCKWGVPVTMAVSLLIGFSSTCAAESDADLDVCKQVSAGQLKQL